MNKTISGDVFVLGNSTNADHFNKGGIIIAGENFGYGDSQGQEVTVYQELGASVIIAESFDRIFYRDAINAALPLLACPGILANASEGDRIEICFAEGIVNNLTTGKSFSGKKPSEYAMSILEGGGIKAVLAEQAQNSGLYETEYTGWDTAKDLLLATACERDRVYYCYLRERMGENPSWADYQQTFFRVIDEYLNIESRKHYKLSIDEHEAGGQLRVAFPHMFVRDAENIKKYMNDYMAARQKYTKNNLFHGYVDCDEIHHEPETFLYFQIPMMYWEYESKDIAAEMILDMAEHCGNFTDDVPAWYDWDKSEFVSTWLGTKSVRAYPVFDYQEGNHFRFINIPVAAYKASGDKRYLDLINSYSTRWCEHIESHAQNEFIPCSILPANAKAEEMRCAGVADSNIEIYQTFYTTVAVGTTHDIVIGLYNAYRLNGNERYIKCAKIMIDQFVKNGKNGRPASEYSDGKWIISSKNTTPAGKIVNGVFRLCECSLLAEMMMIYNNLTGTETYKDAILDWANAINEDENYRDLSLHNVLVYAHYYTGNVDYLVRAQDMYLRFAAMAAHVDVYHQCDVRMNQGNKAMAESLYFPVFGCLNFSVRGSLPLPFIWHITDGRRKLPNEVSFRLWKSGESHKFEAINHSRKTVKWIIETVDKRIQVEIEPLGTTEGLIS